MKFGAWFCAAAPLAMLAAPAFAAPQPPQAQAQTGILVFEPSFFAEAGPNTAYDMIGRLPGFNLDNGDRNKRGLAGAAGNVLIDGQPPSSKTDALDQILRRISAASVERIELIRGGAPGIDMQGRAIMANVVLKRAVQVEKVIETNAYVYDDGYVGPLFKGQYARRNGDHLIDASLSATTDRTGGTADGSRLLFDGAGAPTQTADLDLWDHLVNVTGTAGLQRPLAGGKLRLHGLGSWEKHDNRQDIRVRSGVGSNEATLEHATSTNGEIGGDWEEQIGPRSLLVLTGLQHSSRDTYAGHSIEGAQTSDFGISSTAGESVARGVLRFQPTARWAWESGAEAAYNYLDSATTYAENGVPQALPNASVLVEELRGEAFGQATWQARRDLTIEAGLRIEASRISQTGDTNLSKSFFYPKPRLQLTWTPVEGRQLRLRIQRDVGQLDFKQFTASSEINLGSVQGGNADLEPQKTTIYEVVFEQRFWDKGVFELSAYHSDVQDVIDVIPLAGGTDGVGNIGNGVEEQVQTKITLPLDRFGLANARFTGRWTWTHTRVTDPLTGQERPVSNSQPFGCGVSFDQTLAGGRWSYGAEHGCNIDRSFRYRIAELRETRVEPFVFLYGQWKPTDKLTVRVDYGAPSGQEIYTRRALYAGPRNAFPIDTIEERRQRTGSWVFVQIRRQL